METNELVLKFDKETTLPLLEGLGKSAYAIAAAHGFKGTEQEWLNSLQGIQGPQGEPGSKGEPFTYADFTPEQLQALKGPKGEDGLSAFQIAQLNGFQGTYVEWLKSLKGKDGRDGASATADNAHQLLLQGNVWCESASVDDVLTALIGNMGKPFPRTEFKPLTIPSVIQGQRVIGINGEPHYTVKVVGNDTDVFGLNEAGVGNITIEPLGDDDVKLTYHNFTGDKVGDYTIKGVLDDSAVQPDETYEDLGSKYYKYGRKLVINVTNQQTDSDWARNNFNFLGKWKEQDFDSIEIVTNGKKLLYIYLDYKGLPQIPIFINKPALIMFKLTSSLTGNININIGTKEHGLNNVACILDTLEWSESDNRYISTGAAPL